MKKSFADDATLKALFMMLCQVIPFAVFCRVVESARGYFDLVLIGAAIVVVIMIGRYLILRKHPERMAQSTASSRTIYSLMTLPYALVWGNLLVVAAGKPDPGQYWVAIVFAVAIILVNAATYLKSRKGDK